MNTYNFLVLPLTLSLGCTLSLRQILPGTSMAVGALPLWSQISGQPVVAQTLKGVNACCTGLMASAVITLSLKLIPTKPVVAPGLEGVLPNPGVRAAVVILLLYAQLTLRAPPPVVILSGIALALVRAAWLFVPDDTNAD